MDFKQLFENITKIPYDSFWHEFANKLYGSSGLEIVAWACLLILVFLLAVRRVTAASIIFFLYLVAFCLAYIPAVLKLLKG